MSDQEPSVPPCTDPAASGSQLTNYSAGDGEPASAECAVNSEPVGVPSPGPDAYAAEQDHADALAVRLQPLWDELQRLKSKINAFGSLLEGQRGQCMQGQRDLSRALTGLRVQLGASIDPSDEIGMLLDPGRGEQTYAEEGSEAGDLSGDDFEGGRADVKGKLCANAIGSAAVELDRCEASQLPFIRERLLNIRRSIEERQAPSRTATTPHKAFEEVELQATKNASLPQVGTPPVAVPQEEVLKHPEKPSPQGEEQLKEQQEATLLAADLNNKPGETELKMSTHAGGPNFRAMDRARDEIRQVATNECLRVATDLRDVLQAVSFQVLEATRQQHKAEIEAEVLAWRKEEAVEWRQQWLQELVQDVADLKENINQKEELPEPCPEQACDGQDAPLHVGRMSAIATDIRDLRTESKVNTDQWKQIASRVEFLEREMAFSREHGRCRGSTSQASDTAASPASRRTTARTPSTCSSRFERLRVSSAGRVPVSRIFCLGMPRASSPP